MSKHLSITGFVFMWFRGREGGVCVHTSEGVLTILLCPYRLTERDLCFSFLNCLCPLSPLSFSLEKENVCTQFWVSPFKSFFKLFWEASEERWRAGKAFWLVWESLISLFSSSSQRRSFNVYRARFHGHRNKRCHCFSWHDLQRHVDLWPLHMASNQNKAV